MENIIKKLIEIIPDTSSESYRATAEANFGSLDDFIQIIESFIVDKENFDKYKSNKKLSKFFRTLYFLDARQDVANKIEIDYEKNIDFLERMHDVYGLKANEENVKCIASLEYAYANIDKILHHIKCPENSALTSKEHYMNYILRHELIEIREELEILRHEMVKITESGRF